MCAHPAPIQSLHMSAPRTSIHRLKTIFLAPVNVGDCASSVAGPREQYKTRQYFNAPKDRNKLLTILRRPRRTEDARRYRPRARLIKFASSRPSATPPHPFQPLSAGLIYVLARRTSIRRIRAKLVFSKDQREDRCGAMTSREAQRV